MAESQPKDEREQEIGELFTPYGELVMILDGPTHALREAFRDCSVDQLRDIIMVLEDNINDAHADGSNEEMNKRLLYLRHFAIREIDRKEGREGTNEEHYYTYEQERDWLGY